MIDRFLLSQGLNHERLGTLPLSRGRISKIHPIRDAWRGNYEQLAGTFDKVQLAA
jgi:hypothetical protein